MLSSPLLLLLLLRIVMTVITLAGFAGLEMADSAFVLGRAGAADTMPPSRAITQHR